MDLGVRKPEWVSAAAQLGSACLAFLKPWVPSPALQQLGLVAHIYNHLGGRGKRMGNSRSSSAVELLKDSLGFVRACPKKEKEWSP